MKFISEQEKQAYIDNLEKMVAEITKVELNPEFPGETFAKSYEGIAQFCLKLEDMIKTVEERDVKVKITRALRVVEAFYAERLDRTINAPFIQYMDIPWYGNTIDLLHQSLDNLNWYAPTARTCELYCAFVDEYSQLLQNLLDSKTPGHTACIARYAEELRVSIAAGRAMAARSTSPVNMMLPLNPNEPNNNTRTILEFAPGASPGIADTPFEDSSQSPDRTFSS